MPNVSFSIWWVLAPLLAWLAFTLCVTLVRERRKHAARRARTRRAADILANGTPAMALVISLSDTGQRRSGEGTTWAIAKLHLRVQATAGSEAFEVDQTAAIALRHHCRGARCLELLLPKLNRALPLREQFVCIPIESDGDHDLAHGSPPLADSAILRRLLLTLRRAGDKNVAFCKHREHDGYPYALCEKR